MLVTACLLVVSAPASAAPGWYVLTVDSATKTGSFTSVALDPSGNPHISYYDETDHVLKYTRSDDGGATWPAANIKTVDSSADGRTYTSIKVNAAGNPSISYHDETNGDLKFAYSTDGGVTWPAGNIKTVDASLFDVGDYTSLALDAAGNPRISYCDYSNDNLMFAYSDDGGATWPAANIKIADNGGVGWDTSLGLDPSGNPSIGYRDPVNGYLKFTRSQDGGATWPAENIKIVDTGDTGSYASIALDQDGNPGISYYDWTTTTLKYAYSVDDGATWPAGQIVTVDATDDTGGFTSVARDSSGNPSISYYDVTNGWLKYARSPDGGATWPAGAIVTVDSSGNVGGWTGLALDAAGNPRISYYDWGSNDLKFALYVTALSVRTDAASAIGYSGATLNGNIIPTGAGNADQRGFRYRRQGTTAWTDSLRPGPFGAGAFSTSITGLSAGATYEFKARAHNAAGWSEGSAVTFTTAIPLNTWYLAEGSTDWGFSTSINILNPGTSAVSCTITYMPTDGVNVTRNVKLPPKSSTTISPEESLGQKDFSTKVQSPVGQTIAVDRTMVWTGKAGFPERHQSVGVPAPSKSWYLPEGSSAWGFESWLLVQNPGTADANCTLTYMIEGKGPREFVKKVPAHSRRTYNMAADIGAEDASIKVESDQPVIPERAMYRNDRREGHDSIGTTAPSLSCFLAEGTTGWGFTTYVLVQNPNATDTLVTLTYMTNDGPEPQPPFTMPAGSRKTIRVNDVMPDKDFSTRVTGSAPLIAERAMYWDHGTGEAAHDSIGMDAPHRVFYLPAGESGEDVETWTLVQNPNATDVGIQVKYMTPAGTGNIIFTDTVKANSRKTFNMAEKMSGKAGVVVTCTTSGKKIMVERAMYWNNRGAGADTIGGYSD